MTDFRFQFCLHSLIMSIDTNPFSNEIIPESYNSPVLGPASVGTRILQGAVNAPIRIKNSTDETTNHDQDSYSNVPTFEENISSLEVSELFSAAFSSINQAKSPSTTLPVNSISVSEISDPLVHDPELKFEEIPVHEISIIHTNTDEYNMVEEIISSTTNNNPSETNNADMAINIMETNTVENVDPLQTAGEIEISYSSIEDNNNLPTIIVAASSLLTSSISNLMEDDKCKNELYFDQIALSLSSVTTNMESEAGVETTVNPETDKSNVSTTIGNEPVIENTSVYADNSARKPFKAPRPLAITSITTSSLLLTDPRQKTTDSRIANLGENNDDNDKPNVAVNLNAMFNLEVVHPESVSKETTLNNEKSELDQTIEINEDSHDNAIIIKTKKSVTLAFKPPRKLTNVPIATTITKPKSTTLLIIEEGYEEYVNDLDTTTAAATTPVLHSSSNDNEVVESTSNIPIIPITKKRKPVVLKRSATIVAPSSATTAKRSKVTTSTTSTKKLTIGKNQNKNDSDDDLLSDSDKEDTNVRSKAISKSKSAVLVSNDEDYDEI